MVLDFPIMADYAMINEGKITIFATHGHIYNENNLPKMKKGTVLLHGHTHIADCRSHEDYVYMNPGSVSIPKNDTPHGYMTLEDGVFLWKDFDGNVQLTVTMDKEA